MKIQLHLTIASLLVTACAFSDEPQPAPLRAADSLQGAYQPAIQAIAGLPGNPAHIKFVKLASPGSATTLNQIASGKVDVGIVQADSNIAGANASAVRALYNEAFFFVTKAPADSLSNLSKHFGARKLRIGGLPDGSQTETDCKRVMSEAGVTDFKYVGGDHAATIRRLLDGSVDAAFFVTGIESKTLNPIRNLPGLRLIPVHVTAWNGVGFMKLPAGAIVKNSPAVRTLYTQSLMVASGKSSAKSVEILAHALDTHKEEIRKTAPFVKLSKVPADIQLPTHPGA